MNTKPRDDARRSGSTHSTAVRSAKTTFATVAFATVAIVAGLAALLTTPSAFASEAIAKAEGDLTCTVCHDKPGSKLYTDKGKYYELTGSLEGYDAIIAVFQKCTTCHVRKPGSKKLTPEGRRFARVMDDMNDLRSWVLSSHPPVRAEDVDKKLEEDKEGSGG